MKKLWIAALGVASLSLSACGPEDLFPVADGGVDAGTPFSFVTGTYAVSNAKANGTDECGLLGSYTDPTKKIGVTVAGTQVTFNLANEPTAVANSLPKADLVGNSITNPVEANYTVDYSGCVVRIKRSVVGTVMAASTADLTLSFNVVKETGSCGAGVTSFTSLPCSASYQFTATKE